MHREGIVVTLPVSKEPSPGRKQKVSILLGKKKKKERTTPPNFVSLLNSILTRRKVVGLMHDTVEPGSSTKFFSKS